MRDKPGAMWELATFAHQKLSEKQARLTEIPEREAEYTELMYRRYGCPPLHPFGLVLLPALSKSILLVARNSRQLTNATSAFGSGRIVSARSAEPDSS